MERIEIDLKTGERKTVPLTAEEIAAAEAKSAAEAAMAPQREIERLERENPITHRALREMILAIGAQFPDAQDTVFYQRALQVEQAIRTERAKL